MPQTLNRITDLGWILSIKFPVLASCPQNDVGRPWQCGLHIFTHHIVQQGSKPTEHLALSFWKWTIHTSIAHYFVRYASYTQRTALAMIEKARKRGGGITRRSQCHLTYLEWSSEFGVGSLAATCARQDRRWSTAAYTVVSGHSSVRARCVP